MNSFILTAFILIQIGISLSQPFYQNFIANPTFLNGTFWAVALQKGASASFSFDSNGMRAQISNSGTEFYFVQLLNFYYLNGTEFSLRRNDTIFLHFEAKTSPTDTREIFIDVDDGIPTFQTLIPGGQFRTSITDQWQNFTHCFNPLRNDNGSRVAINLGGTELENPTNDVFIRHLYLMRVPFCPVPTTSAIPSFVDKSSPTEGNKTIGIIVGASVGVIVVIILVAVIFVLQMKRRLNKKAIETKENDSIEIEASPQEHSNNSMLRINESEIPFSELIIGAPIGVGAFGTVFKGEWRLQKVAIKMLNAGNLSERLNFFREESKVMLKIRPHANIVQLLGICSTDPEKLCLVTEYYANGSLENYLKKRKNMDTPLVTRLIRQIAAGMFHLAKEGVVHRDLSARNVLLDDVGNPKIADFGLSRLLEDEVSRTTNSTIGALKWMAPESLSKREYSEKSDIWMFGCTCYEIIYKQYPYPGVPIIDAAVLSGELKPIVPPVEEWGIVSEVMERCFQFEPEKRPTFAQICTTLGSNLPNTVDSGFYTF